ncbi:MAG: hypothetical protein ABJN34_03050 [Litoreibacter sp.]|uniref:hypothetical protein n=1 Tax=Litoreibacter sp. TaxID=1969459 RepID=UPI003299582D
MRNRLFFAAALFALSACSEINYTDNRLVAKYTYDGVTYDVYEAIEVNQSGFVVNGSSAETQRAVYRLFPEGADPQVDGSTTGVIFGAAREITTCAATLDECKVAFGKVLEKRKAQANKPEREEGGMY